MSHWCPVLWNLSTVKCHLYIQCKFVNRRESAWWNFTTFKWPHGQCSGKTGRYVHHHYWGANGGEELLYWPCPACHLRTILCCTLTYYWTSQLVADRINQKKDPDPVQIFPSYLQKSRSAGLLWKGQPVLQKFCCLAWCKKDSVVWQFTFLQIFYTVWFGAKRTVLYDILLFCKYSILSGLGQKGRSSMAIYFFANILYCLVWCKMQMVQIIRIGVPVAKRTTKTISIEKFVLP